MVHRCTGSGTQLGLVGDWPYLEGRKDKLWQNHFLKVLYRVSWYNHRGCIWLREHDGNLRWSGYMGITVHCETDAKWTLCWRKTMMHFASRRSSLLLQIWFSLCDTWERPMVYYRTQHRVDSSTACVDGNAVPYWALQLSLLLLLHKKEGIRAM